MSAVTADQLVDAWHTNQRINALLLRRISAAGLRTTLSTRGGRDVARQFAHLHNVRVWHLERRAKVLAQGLGAFETEERLTRAALERALSASADAVAELLRGIVLERPGVRSIKGGAAQVLAYFVAHESHHRGNILLTLKQSGHALDQKLRYAIWDWNRI